MGVVVKALPWILVVLLAIGLFYRCGDEKVHNLPYYDTIPFYDTIRYDTVIPRDSVIISYQVVKLPVLPDTTLEKALDSTVRDSAEVVIPITQKHYKEVDFEAWVSGYRAELDSFHIFSKGFYLKEKVKRKRWGIGLQAGYGYPTGWYVGAGVTFNLWQW